MKHKYFILSCLLLLSQTSAAKNQAQEAASQSLPAVTIYLDINVLSRKHRAAKKMTELHQQFAKEGYELLTINPYSENGDLQGFYISYKKSVN